MSTYCLNCGSKKLAIYDTQYFEDGWDIEVIHYYECEDCGRKHSGTAYYTCNDESEYMEEMEDQKMKNNLYRKYDDATYSWDLNASCRDFTPNTKHRRQLRKRLRRRLRKVLNNLPIE